MKKLLLVLLVVALASFLFVGCLPTTPAEGEGEGEGEAEICPTIIIDGSFTDPVSGKTYIKGSADEVVVTFAQPTEGVNIYLSASFIWSFLGKESKDISIFDLPLAYTVSADGTTYTAYLPDDLLEELDCAPFMIKVVSCEGLCECVESFVVDAEQPYVALKLTMSGEYEDCPCGGCALTVSSVVEEYVCDPDLECCGDDCSGLASWSFRLFDEPPWNVCCDAGCEDPIFEASGTDCPIEFTTDCLDEGTYYAILDLVDNVGNETNIADAFEIYRDGDCYLGYAYLELPEECDYDEFEWCWDYDWNPIVFADPDGMMDGDCWNICYW